jgi:integrase
VLNRAVAWGLIDYNPAKRGVPNPPRRYKEKRPFESWEQLEAVAQRLGPIYGPMMVFAAATGLRPSELFALEQRDIDRALGVVYVRRAFANGRLKNTKTRLSTRAVPLQAIALEALDRLPAAENPLLSPTRVAATLTSAASAAATGNPPRSRPASSRCAISTTRATHLRHSASLS